uniref:Kinesin family member 20B n=1 Tax=Nothobranchius furzeri TaxID=105023 RepID=A0A8C6MJ97_NOTFU
MVSVLQQSYMDEREHLKVFLRVRPFTSAEQTSGESQDCVTIEPPDTVLLKPPNLSALARLSSEKFLPQTGQRFQFSSVHGPQTSQKELFDGTVRDLVKDVLDGGRSLVFTYGVTNSGKTFTFLGPDSDAGILPRSLGVIFSSIGEKIFTGMCIKPHRCREFSKLSWEQQAEEALFKRSLLRQFKEVINRLLQSLMSCCTGDSTTESSVLNVETNTKFSIWVSFCEIYNENIHDLLEVAPNGAPRRIALRLSQDVKGNAFVKDLRWVQVSSTEEACKVVKLGRKNQSFSSTRLNQLSSRSHSLFSIRVLRIEDIGTPRVHTISELCVCDLAGSERCAKTQNKGERLKEAGNINTSLLILGKCINIHFHLQTCLQLCVLTHYLQSFFCGQGKACMIVNINQCASMLDETLNVLKFSAVAQKVVVLSCRPLPIMLQTSSGEVTRNAERKALLHNKRSWDSGLEDVQVLLKFDFLMVNLMKPVGTLLIAVYCFQRQVALLNHLQVQLKKERAENMLLEARVREEICQEFTELFSKMQNDYNVNLSKSSQASSKTERAEQTSVQLQTVQALLEERTLEVQEKTSKISALTQEVQRLQLEVQPSKLKDGLRKLLTEEKEENQIKQAQIKELEHQLEKIKQQLEHKLVSDQQLNQNEQASKQQIEELRKKLQKQETVSQKQLEELRVQLGSQQHDSTAQVEQLTEKLLQQTQASEKQIKQLKEQLREQEVFFRQQLEELELKLGQKQTTSSNLLDQEHSVEQLRAELEEAQHNSTSISSATKDLTRINSDLQTRVASLTEKLTSMNELKQVMEEKNQQLEEKLADLLTASAQKEAKLHKKLQDMEEQVTSLQRSLQKAQEQREEESQAMQDARRREVERRRELLAVAHEAIAQKDAELEKRAMEIMTVMQPLTFISCVFPQGSAGFPSVLESSEISTENGRTSRFPRPELEISFSPLQPNRMALRRQGEESAVTVKINRAARKRKSSEMEKVENYQKVGGMPIFSTSLETELVQGKLFQTPSSSPVGSFNSYNRKEGTLQKIGDFLQSSPTLLGTKGQRITPTYEVFLCYFWGNPLISASSEKKTNFLLFLSYLMNVRRV